MEYFTKDELRRLFSVAYGKNKLHHLALVTSLSHGLRISETLAIKGTDVCDGKLKIKRLKKSNVTCQPIVKNDDPLFDESPIIPLAELKGNEKLFPWSRQYMDILIKQYGKQVNIHPSKLHAHSIKHSTAMAIWEETKSLGDIKSYLGHKSSSSTMCYLNELDSQKAQKAIAGIKW